MLKPLIRSKNVGEMKFRIYKTCDKTLCSRAVGDEKNEWASFENMEKENITRYLLRRKCRRRWKVVTSRDFDI